MRSRPFISKKRKNEGRVCKELHFQQLLTTFIITGRHGQWYSSNKYNDELDNINKKRKLYSQGESEEVKELIFRVQEDSILKKKQVRSEYHALLRFDILKVTMHRAFHKKAISFQYESKILQYIHQLNMYQDRDMIQKYNMNK